MKTLLFDIRDYIREDFDKKLYLAVGIFISVLIAFNYAIDLEDTHIDALSRRDYRWFLFFIENSVGYYGTVFILVLVTKRKDLFTQTSFWIKSALGLLLFSVHRSLNFTTEIRELVSPVDFSFAYYVINNMFSLFTLVLPLFILLMVYDRKTDFGFYGLRIEGVKFRPYLVILAIMIPLVFMASFTKGFSSYYPVYAKIGGAAFAQAHSFSERWAIFGFEFFYLTDFLSVELLFRGFFILGMVKYLGKDCILPMVTIYAMCHFGKPMGETISSVFGGFLLGVLAYKSKNIWGGVVVHIGIAMFMEVFAFYQLS